MIPLVFVDLPGLGQHPPARAVYTLDDALNTSRCEISLYEKLFDASDPNPARRLGAAGRSAEEYEAARRRAHRVASEAVHGAVLRAGSTGDAVYDALAAAALIRVLEQPGYTAPDPNQLPELIEIPAAAPEDGAGIGVVGEQCAPGVRRVAAERILPVFDGLRARLEVLTRAAQAGSAPADIARVLACGQCPACARVSDAEDEQLPEPELVATEDTAGEQLAHPADGGEGGYTVLPATEPDDERYELQQRLDARLAALEKSVLKKSVLDKSGQKAAASGEPTGAMNEDERTLALVLSATNYHRRERAPWWREHMRRLHEPVASWAGTRDCAVFDTVQVVADWERAGTGSGQVRVLRATATLVEGSALASAGAGLFVMYAAADAPARALDAMESQVNTFRRANPGGYVPRVLPRVGFFGGRILSIEPVDSEPVGTDGSAGAQGFVAGVSTPVVLTIEERIRVKDEPHYSLPVALGAAATVPTAVLERSLQDFAAGVEAEFPVFAASAALDILRRRPPRRAGGGALPRESDFAHAQLPAVQAVLEAVRTLDCSYVAVQGPPGSGKTFLGSHVIASLVASGWRVGVVAQSHAVVENMLAAVIERGMFPPERAAKLAGTSHSPQPVWAEWSKKTLQQECAASGGLGAAPGSAAPGFVFGGTAWNFSNASLFESGTLDLLVVDEAGQFSLAHTVASARAARNLLLLGDPQQLPQVSTAAHPYPVDISTLGWLSAGAPTLDARFGYFLGLTWRMHPVLCAPVSRLSYGGQLVSADAASARRLAGWKPGLYLRQVAHEQCTVRSVAEAEAVTSLVRQLLGCLWDDGRGQPRELCGEDVVVVAAYNAQVDTIREHLVQAGLVDDQGRGVRVGTVDKFQGQQAPVTIVSMAASRAGDSAAGGVDAGRGTGRGAQFLLCANRLNVAISRGQWCSFVVCSPLLHRFVPATVDELLLLGDFMVLCASGTEHAE